MVDTLRYKDWMEKAQRDVKSAKILKEHDCGSDVVAFHCQQAAEKALKAYLIVNGEGIVSGIALYISVSSVKSMMLNLKSSLKTVVS